MLSLLTNFGFTVAFFAAVAATAVFVFGFDAPFEVMVAMLVLGFVTALAEQYMRSRNEQS